MLQVVRIQTPGGWCSRHLIASLDRRMSSSRDIQQLSDVQAWGEHLCMLLASLSGEGNGTPLQYSCLENPMDGGAW